MLCNFTAVVQKITKCYQGATGDSPGPVYGPQMKRNGLTVKPATEPRSMPDFAHDSPGF